MAVIKLKKEKMAKNKPQKPTMQQITNVINGLIQDNYQNKNDIMGIVGTTDLLVQWLGEKLNCDPMEFKTYIETRIKAQKGQEKLDELQKTGQDNKVADTADSSN